MHNPRLKSGSRLVILEAVGHVGHVGHVDHVGHEYAKQCRHVNITPKFTIYTFAGDIRNALKPDKTD
jgi:hypothetical protein